MKFALLLFMIVGSAQAADQRLEQSLNAISRARIDADIAEANKDFNFSMRYIDYDSSYIVCVSEEKNPICHRYIAYEAQADFKQKNMMNALTVAVALDYTAKLVGDKVVVEKDAEWKEGWANTFHYPDLIKRLLPTALRDYQHLDGARRLAFHPFQIQISILSNLLESPRHSDDTDESITAIFSFIESFDQNGTLSGTSSMAYLVKAELYNEVAEKFSATRIGAAELSKSDSK